MSTLKKRRKEPKSDINEIFTVSTSECFCQGAATTSSHKVAKLNSVTIQACSLRKLVRSGPVVIDAGS